MHRDISIGNLLKLVSPAMRIRFHLNNMAHLCKALEAQWVPEQKPVLEGVHNTVRVKAEMLHAAALAPTDKDGNTKWSGYGTAAKSVQKKAEELLEKVKALNIDEQCSAIVSDGDLTAFMPTYFSTEHNTGTISVS